LTGFVTFVELHCSPNQVRVWSERRRNAFSELVFQHPSQLHELQRSTASWKTTVSGEQGSVTGCTVVSYQYCRDHALTARSIATPLRSIADPMQVVTSTGSSRRRVGLENVSEAQRPLAIAWLSWQL